MNSISLFLCMHTPHRTKTARSEGGLGENLRIPLVSDLSHKIASDYGVLVESGHSLRCALPRVLYLHTIC